MAIKNLIAIHCTQTRGRTGMEVNPLVFETSASTDSAIWAIFIDCGCKGTLIFYICKFYITFFIKRWAFNFLNFLYVGL